MKSIISVICLACWAGVGALAQGQSRAVVSAAPSGRPIETVAAVNPPAPLTRFSLDFEGGPAVDLIKSIEKAMNKPINVIIPDDAKDFQIPSFQVHDVTLPQLFRTITMMSQAQETQRRIGLQMYRINSTVGFSASHPAGPYSDQTLWYFFKFEQQAPDVSSNGGGPFVVVFYQLGPFLDAYRLEDITTAIETGWQMEGLEAPSAHGSGNMPKMKYHKETKLLIAFGQKEQLRIIEQVLQELAKGKPLRKTSDSQIESSKASVAR